jgi:ATP-dependent Clp protease ATP-binding subunit ClpA
MITKRLTTDAREAVLHTAGAEARRRGDTRIGTEHLLIALVAEPQPAAALGFDLDQMREARQRLDAQALDAVGLDPALVTKAGVDRTRRGRLPLTNGAKQMLRRAIDESNQLNESAITVRHFLLAILDAEPPDPAADLLRYLDVDTRATRASLLAGQR